MNCTEILDALKDEIVARNLYFVDVSVSKDNDVVITIDSEEGIVDLEDCVQVSRKFESCFDREKEDYSITVTSAGLDQPFKVMKQYQKAVGKKVEVQIKGGARIVGELASVDEDGIVLNYSKMELVEGSKRKQLVEHSDKFLFSDVNSTREYIDFE